MAQRKLTTEEIKLASHVYGKMIDFSLVRVLDKMESPFPHRMIIKDVPFTLGNDIFFDGSGSRSACLFSHDFSLAEKSDQHYFIHELGHVWQYQNLQQAGFIGYKYRFNVGVLNPIHNSAALTAIKDTINNLGLNKENLNQRYLYTLYRKDIQSYGTEQQAELIADCFYLRKFGFEKYKKNTRSRINNSDEETITCHFKRIIKSAGLPTEPWKIC